MKILKARRFSGYDELTTFVMDNNIPREGIFTIKSSGDYSLASFTMFITPIQKLKKKNATFGVS